MLIETLKQRIADSVKAKDATARDVLRLALSEVQLADARSGRPQSDDEVVAIVRKLVKANEETLALTDDAERAATLRHELVALTALLPKTLSVSELVEALAEQRDAIRAAKADGQATGLAIKFLKGTDAVFQGSDVTEAVKAIRAQV